MLLFTRCVAIALLGATSARASKFEDNPVTTSFEDKALLNHHHPAFGADVAPEVIEYRIAEVVEPLPRVTNASTPQPEATVGAANFRRLEASNADIERLEKYFGTPMELNFATLNKQYKSAKVDPAPWPSSYWPVYADGINYRWQGSDVLSPSEKYATAYGLSVKEFTAKVSQSNGILSQSRRRSCKVTSECDSLKDGSVCGIRQGESKGYCIPGWFGICHAWAPAAILEKEPKCAVKKGSVTFQPYDIKGLLTQIYDGASVDTVFTGARFNGPDIPAVFDEYGRYKDAARRDLGPGFFHIAITNIMGKFKKGFVVDVTAGSEVWNQPVRDYEIAETKALTLSQGAKEYFQTNKYPFNSDAKSLMYVHTKFRWIVESGEDGPLVETGEVDRYTQTGDYEYLLELDAQNNIIGGETDSISNVYAVPRLDSSTNNRGSSDYSCANTRDTGTHSRYSSANDRCTLTLTNARYTSSND
ncbi:Elicitor-like transglutaminase, partial [Globisporangium splendens]